MFFIRAGPALGALLRTGRIVIFLPISVRLDHLRVVVQQEITVSCARHQCPIKLGLVSDSVRAHLLSQKTNLSLERSRLERSLVVLRICILALAAA